MRTLLRNRKSTGEQEDLTAVNSIYRKRMSAFQPESIGKHTWNNGYQEIAAITSLELPPCKDGGLELYLEGL